MFKATVKSSINLLSCSRGSALRTAAMVTAKKTSCLSAVALSSHAQATDTTRRSSRVLRQRCFSTAAHTFGDPADFKDVPIDRDPSPEATLDALEGRAITCADPQRSRIILGPSPAAEQYFAGIVRNVRLMESYFGTVDRMEFKNADVEPGSPIDRGRQAYMLYSRIADEWMERALVASQGEVDEEVLDLFQYFRMNVKLIDLYLQGDAAPPPRPTWADICDAIIVLANWAHGPLDKAAGGVPRHEVLYHVAVTSRGDDGSEHK